MRVLLVYTKNNYPDLAPSRYIIGQGMPYIAGALRAAGHDVAGINIDTGWCADSAEATLTRAIRRRVADFQPDLIGVGGLSANYRFLRDAIRAARDTAPHTPIVLGGSIVTYDAEFISRDLRPDFAVRGDAEETVVALVDHLQRGADLDTVPGIAFRRDGEYVFTPVRYSTACLDDLPLPDYDPFDFETYLCAMNQADTILGYSRTEPRVLPLSLGRSCPFKCTFCCHSEGPKYRQRSIGNTIEEMGLFYERYRFNMLCLYDELFSYREERTREFCARVKQLKRELNADFEWTCAMRITNVTRDLLREMKDAGCLFVGYGLESASPTVLRSMKKGITLEQMEHVLRLSDEVGIGAQGNFIFGDIAETEETIRETMSFFDMHCRHRMIHLGPVTPYPGSELFEHCVAHGLIADRRRYYEETGCIGQYRINMTAIPDETFYATLDVLSARTAPHVHEQLGLADAEAASFECLGPYAHDRESGAPPTQWRSLYRIAADCPHCEHRATYELPLLDAPWNYPGCVRAYCPTCHHRYNLHTEAGFRALGITRGPQVLESPAGPAPVRHEAAAIHDVAVALLEAGDAACALPYLERLMEIAPESAETHLLVGRALLAMRQHAPARAHLLRAAEGGAAPTETTLAMASLCWREGAIEEALDWTLRALRMRAATDDWPEEILSGWRAACEVEGAFSPGIDPEKLDRASGGGAACCLLGESLFGDGQEALAYEAFRLAIDLEPACSQAWNDLGVLHSARGELAEARRALYEAQRLDSGNEEIAENLAALDLVQAAA